MSKEAQCKTQELKEPFSLRREVVVVESVEPHSSNCAQQARRGALGQVKSSPRPCVCRPGRADKHRAVVKSIGTGAQTAVSYLCCSSGSGWPS